MNNKWKVAPHGHIPKQYREWYIQESGYFHDKRKSGESSEGWIVDADDVVNDIIQEKDGKSYKKGDLVSGLKAYRFNQRYGNIKKNIMYEYPNLKPTNEQIFDRMNNKVIKINNQEMI